LDDPLIRIRPNLTAHAGAKEKNPAGSSRFSMFIISPKVFTHQQILLTSCSESLRKGLMVAPRITNMPDGRRIYCHPGAGGAKIRPS
jgi:hypothetical protein